MAGHTEHPASHQSKEQRNTIRFGTDGWRAVIGEGFTYDNIERVTRGVAEYILERFSTEKPVVIGYDTRFMADRFAAFAAEILTTYGLSVLLTERYTPTPIVAFAAREYDSAGALMFTASHNPPEYCGIKYIPEYAGPATPDITEALLAKIAQGGSSLKNDSIGEQNGKSSGAIERFDPFPRYSRFLAGIIRFDALKARPLKILHDPMYGAGQGYLNQLFQDHAGYALTSLHDRTDPLFGGHLPEPKAEYLTELLSQVASGGYDFGIANDGDADRIGIADEKGQFYPTNWLLPILFRYLYTRRGMRGSVVRTVATSRFLDALAEKYGVTVHETPVGFKYVGDWMRREPVIIGGEESGGLSVLGHIPEKDGLFVALLVAELCATEQKPLSRILADTLADAGRTLHQAARNFHLSETAKQAVLQQLDQLKPGRQFADRTILDVQRLDGIKLLFDDWDWILLRPSGTEPILRFYAEAMDPAMLDQFSSAVDTLIQTPVLSAQPA